VQDVWQYAKAQRDTQRYAEARRGNTWWTRRGAQKRIIARPDLATTIKFFSRIYELLTTT